MKNENIRWKNKNPNGKMKKLKGNLLFSLSFVFARHFAFFYILEVFLSFYQDWLGSCYVIYVGKFICNLCKIYKVYLVFAIFYRNTRFFKNKIMCVSIPSIITLLSIIKFLPYSWECVSLRHKPCFQIDASN